MISGAGKTGPGKEFESRMNLTKKNGIRRFTGFYFRISFPIGEAILRKAALSDEFTHRP